MHLTEIFEKGQQHDYSPHRTNQTLPVTVIKLPALFRVFKMLNDIQGKREASCLAISRKPLALTQVTDKSIMNIHTLA